MSDVYVGYCVECGAKHEIEDEERCMCGGQVVDADALGQLAHRLWTYWSQAIADEESIDNGRVNRWEDLWVPYENLSDESQTADRVLVKQFLIRSPDYEES